MNYDSKIESAISMATNALNNANALQHKYEAAKVFTGKLLSACEEKGITKVSVGVASKKVPASFNYPFGANGSIFQFIPKSNRGDTWPPIWDIVDKLGIGGGCGNSDQKQADLTDLIDGVYELKKGQWKKTD